MQRRILLIILSILWLSPASDAWSDAIHLKNKRILKGVIKEETDTTVALDIGIGKITVQKSEIESIEKAGEEDQASLIKDFKKKEIEKGAFVPKGLEEISDKFQELKAAKRKTDAARYEFSHLREEFTEKKRKFNSLMSTFNAKNIELKNLEPSRDVKYYNKVVSDVNSLGARLASSADELINLNSKYPEYSKAVQKAIITYKDTLVNFKIYFDGELKSAKEKQLSEDETCFYETIEEALANLEGNLRRDSIALSKSAAGLVVEVKLNDTLTCVMIVDTGASTVTITPGIANQLGLDLSAPGSEIEGTLADGSKTKAKIVNLKSVAVGNSRAENVMAVVLDNPPGPGVDGLLGMSFLGNFSVKLDSVNDKLVLETIK